MPSTSDLQAIREHVAVNHQRLRRTLAASSFRAAVGQLSGEQLTRVPRGYPKDHPAADYLRFKQFLAGREFEAEFAASTRFYPELLRIFKAIAPLVRFLNEPLLQARRTWDLGDRGLAAASARDAHAEQPRRRLRQTLDDRPFNGT
jgi:uncharacterized protein (DUF2461 family)